MLTLKPDHDVTIFAHDQGFKYIAKENKIISTSFKEYEFEEKKDLTVHIIADRRSTEMCINDEIMLTFSSSQPSFFQVLTDYYIEGVVYKLESIWDK